MLRHMWTRGKAKLVGFEMQKAFTWAQDGANAFPSKSQLSLHDHSSLAGKGICNDTGCMCLVFDSTTYLRAELPTTLGTPQRS